MTILNINAEYTGGGIWLFHGQTDRGWFLTDDMGSTLLLDCSAENFDESLETEWQEGHKVAELAGKDLWLFQDELLHNLRHDERNTNRNGMTDTEITRYEQNWCSEREW